MTADDWNRRSVCEEESAQRMSESQESKTNLEVLSDFTDEPLEGKLPDEELSGLLVTPDFTKGDGSGPEAMGLLDTTSGSLPRQELSHVTEVR